MTSSRTTLIAFNKQIKQLSAEIQTQECGLIELGRMHARNFDVGHHASGSSLQRVFAELRRLAQREAKDAAKEQARVEAAKPVERPVSQLDQLRARRDERAG